MIKKSNEKQRQKPIDKQILHECHTIYALQYEDAFKFVKRQQSDRNRLHSLSQYEESSVENLLHYLGKYYNIHSMY